MEPETRSDEDIQRDVIEELKFEPRLQPVTEIGVAVKDGIISLVGSVDSYTRRWAAEKAAHRVRGVRAVANDVEVRLPYSSERGDADLAAAVVRALESNTWLKPEHFEVTISNGWVTLKGQVEWQFQREEAEHAFRSLWGVKGISNLVAVKARPTPAELKHDIERALVRNAEADARTIEVEVDGSTVILKGRVRAWSERQEAERVAWMAPGVTHVEDHIQVAAK